MRIWPSAEAAARFVAELKANGALRGWEQEFLKKSGEAYMAELSAQVLVIGGEKVILSTMVDITQRKQAEEALRESEEKFAKAFRSAPYALTITRQQDGLMTEVNEGFCEISGYSEAEAVGRTAIDLGLWVNPTERSGVVEELSRTGRVRNREFRFRTKTGRIMVGLLNSEVVQLGNQPCILSSISDITERKRAEEELRQSRDEWERTFNSVPDLIAILDAKHRVVQVNKAMADRLGVTPEQAKGVHCYEIVHGTSVPPGFCPHTLTCEDAKEHVAEVHEPRLGGDFLVSTTPICDASGRLTGSVHVARDITARKRAEIEIARQLDELQRWQAVMLDREDRVMELKREVNELLRRSGKPIRYQSQAGEAETRGKEDTETR
jgi:PAS domain S-box-containing protein